MNRPYLFGPLAMLLGIAVFAADEPALVGPDILRVLAAYPKPIREAILELANHPDLVKKLDPKGKGIDKALAGQPDAVQKAGQLLAKEPEVLMLLQDDPDAYAPAAKQFAKDRIKIAAQMDDEEKQDAKAVDEWGLRLDEDQEALQQLEAASAAYAKQPGGTVDDAGISAGATASEVNVHTLPTPGFVNYAMANADKYPALANTMTSQWLSSRNSASYDGAFHQWWGARENYFHDSLLHKDADRGQRLGELAHFDRQHASEDASKRYRDFDKHAKDFPGLAKLPKHDPNHKPLAHDRKPDHKDGHPAGKDPNRKPYKGDHKKVHRKPPSHHQHMHHAKAGHHHHAKAHHHHGKGKK